MFFGTTAAVRSWRILVQKSKIDRSENLAKVDF
jgi:hypothetical protein